MRKSLILKGSAIATAREPPPVGATAGGGRWRNPTQANPKKCRTRT